jgi:3-oxoacyl-[acyl-carrier protein] reductase
MRLADKVVIITGAGSGIGRSAAYLFAEEGAKVVVADINNPGGEETVSKIKAKRGTAIFIHTDLSISSQVENLIKTTINQFGRVDVLYNNAGIGQKLTPIEDIEESYWDQILSVNLKSVFLAVKYAVPYMKRAGGGVIINTASIAGVRPRPHTSAYVSSKGGVIALTKVLAIELASNNIRVNCINPVATDTPMLDALDEEDKKAWAKTIPMGRLAKPEDMAYAALYLASDESSMVTGVCLNVDGGRGI